MIYLKINGKEVQAEPGMTILQAADANGIRIPRMCYHKGLNPIGSCRICVVEVKPGPPRPQPACTTPVADNMEVTTHSERLDAYRRKLLQLLLINHPLDCPICDKGGECELQDLTRELKIDYQPYQAQPLVPRFDSDSPLIERYPDRCINCERCVRVCQDRVGAAALSFENRGYRAAVTTGGSRMDCEFCGSCVAVCPVGAIVDKTFRHRARAWELQRQGVVCPYCGGGCELIVNHKEGHYQRITSSFDSRVNGGIICNRGRFGMNVLEHGQRLTTPLVRKDGKLERAGWDEALALVAERLAEVRERYGGTSIAGIGSPRVANEANYLFQKCCRLALATPHVASSAALNHQRMVRALKNVLGRPRIHGSGDADQRIREVSGFQEAMGNLDNLDEADAVLVLGADLKREMPLYVWHINDALKKDSLKYLAVVGAEGFRLRSRAHWSVFCRPGSDGFVVLGILKFLLGAKGKEQSAAAQFKGRKKLGGLLRNTSWKRLEAVTGIGRKDFEQLGQRLTRADRPVLIVGNQLAGLPDSDRIGQYLGDLLLILGRRLKLLLVAEKANTQGCSDMGVAPDWLPGYLPMSEAEALGRVWGRTPPAEIGLDLDRILASATEGDDEGERIRALWVMGGNPLATLPDRDRTEKALKNLDFLVCQEAFLNETAALADCVLPAFMTVETPGTVTNTEFRVQRQPGIRFLDGPRPDWQIIQDISTRLGYAMDYRGPADIFSEMSRVFPYLDQYRFDEIPKEGFCWSKLHRAKFGSATWKRKLDPTLEAAVPKLETPPATDSQYPFLLSVGYSLFQSGTLARYGRGSQEVEPLGNVRLNPGDAASLGLDEEDRVVLTSRYGRLTTPVVVDSYVPQGIVHASFHFADIPIGRLLKMGTLCPVRVEKAREE